ncbi:MAG: AAA family ATPase [Beijerinckiaceae bacterium]
MNMSRPVLPEAPLSYDMAEPRRLEVSELFAILRRKKWTVLTTMGILAGLALGYILFTPKQYTAQTVVMIEPKRSQIFRQDLASADPVFDTSAVESQLEALKSEGVLLAVIRNMKLTQDSEFVGASINPLGMLISAMRSLFASPDPDSETSLQRRAIGKFKENLDARRVGLSYALSISYTSTSPAKAASIANEIAEAYMLDQVQAKFELSHRAGSWLQGRIRDLQKQASEAERLVLDYKADKQIVDASGRLVNEQQLTELNTKLGEARGATAEAQARLNQIRDVLQKGVADASVTDILRNELFTKLRQDFLEKIQRANELSVRYGPTHEQVTKLRSEARGVERSMFEELRRLEQAYSSDYEIAKARELSADNQKTDLMSRWASTRQAQVELKELESTAQSYRTLHDNFVQRYLAAVQQQSFPISDARIITPATAPAQPSAPKSMLILAGALVLGFGLGGALALAREMLDRRVRTAAQMNELTGVDTLGLLPAETVRLEKPAEYYLGLLGTSARLAPGRALFSIIERRPILWMALHKPFSTFAETIRHIKVAIETMRMKRRMQTICMVSSNAGEGKTTTVVNLALVMARSEQTVLLIDCDLRKPQATRLLAPEAEAGLLEVLTGTRDLMSVVHQDRVTGLNFLPAVVTRRPDDTTHFLSSDAMRHLLAQAAEKFDYVLIDAPPVGPAVDVRALAHMVDGFVMVAEWGVTTMDAVRRVAGSEFIHPKLVGTVLTKANLKAYRTFSAYHDPYYDDGRAKQ